MSHVVKLTLDVTDLDCLRSAAEQLGMVLESADTYIWWGRYMADSPLPAGFTAADLGKCQYRLRIPGDREAYQVGVVRQRDGRPGYALLFDEWAGGKGLVEHIGAGGCRLKQEYAIAAARKQMLREGYKVTRTVNATTGKPQLRMRRA